MNPKLHTISPESDCYPRLAIHYALRQIRALKTHLQRIRRTGDGRSLHQSRVASRRLRAALSMLPAVPSGKKGKKLKKTIRRITRELGQARDKDVEIVFLQEFLKKTREGRYRPAISRMLLRARQERKSLQPQVDRVIRDFRQKATLHPLQEHLKSVASVPEKAFLLNSGTQTPLTASNPVLTELEAFLSLAPCLGDPLDTQRHHLMRIAAKRLRYTMEICAPLYDRTWTSKLNQMKALQTALGEIRDCDVRLEKLDAFLREEKRRTREYFGYAKSLAELQPGMDYLRERLQTLRRNRFASLVRLWQRLRRQRFWESLIPTSNSPAGEKPGRPTVRRSGVLHTTGRATR